MYPFPISYLKKTRFSGLSVFLFVTYYHVMTSEDSLLYQKMLRLLFFNISEKTVFFFTHTKHRKNMCLSNILTIDRENAHLINVIL